MANVKRKKGVIGILTGGGDVPGLNPAIRAVTIRAIREGYQVIGIRRGWAGAIDLIRDKKADNSGNFEILTEQIVDRAGRTGGTFLHSSRTRPSHVAKADVPEHLKETYLRPAIAGEMAAETYGLRVLASRIEDHPDNKTRFLVIGRQRVGPSGRDKTSILVSTRNEPGALYKVLEPFHSHGISLTRIETRPAKSGSWSYVFFIDFDGHQSDPEIQKVLDEVRAVSMEVRSLGSYPQAVV